MWRYSWTIPGLELQPLEIHATKRVAPCLNANYVSSATAYREEEMQLTHRLVGDRHGTWAGQEMTSSSEMRADVSWPFINLKQVSWTAVKQPSEPFCLVRQAFLRCPDVFPNKPKSGCNLWQDAVVYDDSVNNNTPKFIFIEETNQLHVMELLEILVVKYSLILSASKTTVHCRVHRNPLHDWFSFIKPTKCTYNTHNHLVY
jgi:hypothetical protein